MDLFKHDKNVSCLCAENFLLLALKVVFGVLVCLDAGCG